MIGLRSSVRALICRHACSTQPTVPSVLPAATSILRAGLVGEEVLQPAITTGGSTVSSRNTSSSAQAVSTSQPERTDGPFKQGRQTNVRPRGTVALIGREPKPGSLQDKEVELYNFQREAVGRYVLPGDIFDVPIRTDILHRVVRWQLAKRQQGTHKAKTRGEVRGGGRKPWPQKGSGRARAGSIRAPHWRGGGVTFPPVLRSHAHDLNRKFRRMGLKCALSAKAQEGRLIMMDSVALEAPKTKILDNALDKMLVGAPRRSVLMADSSKTGPDGGFTIRAASSNLPWVDVVPSDGLNVYSILQRDYLLLTRAAADAVTQRLRASLKR